MPKLYQPYRPDAFYHCLGDLLVVIGAFYYSLFSVGIFKNPRAAAFCYREVHVSVILCNSLILYRHFTYNTKFPSEPLHEDQTRFLKYVSFYSLLTSVLWLVTTPLVCALLPLAVRSMINILCYELSRTHPGYPQVLARSSQNYSFRREFWTSYIYKMNDFSADCELYLLARVLIYALSFRADALVQGAVYFVLFKLRHDTDMKIIRAVEKWEDRLDRYAIHPKMPLKIRRAWFEIKAMLKDYVGPLFQFEFAATPRK